MKKQMIAGTIAAMFAGVAVVAQTPAPEAGRPQTPPTETRRPTQDPAATAQSPAKETTLTGCVYREQDVAGRTPNVAERAGVMEDYILADVKAAGQESTSPSSATPGVAGTSGAIHPMYKLEKIADERLRSVVGKRVEVTGRVDAERGDVKSPDAAPQADKSVGPDKIDLAEFEVTEIREVPGTCAAKPAGRN